MQNGTKKTKLSPTQKKLLAALAQKVKEGAAEVRRCSRGKNTNVPVWAIREFMGGFSDAGEWGAGDRIRGLRWTTWTSLRDLGLLRRFDSGIFVITKKGLDALKEN